MEGDNYSYNTHQYGMHNGQDDAGPSSNYDGHSNHIQLPSYASSPTSPQTPISPRAMAIQQLKRAASLREQKGNNTNTSTSHENGALLSSSQHYDTAPASASASTSNSGHSPSIGMSPSMSRAPSIKRLGLERSASDAARRMAMAKLTGEKISPPPEFTMPKTPLPAGPLPSLADLQARHEQRLGLASPEPVPSTSSGSPPHPLSRNPSSASTALSRQLSAASNRTGASNLSRKPSLARSLAASQGPSGAAAGSGSNISNAGSDQGHGSQESGSAEDDESKQRRTDERQEARSNLIRKLSRGRLAGAAAAANIRERHANNNAMPVDAPEPSTSTSNPASPGLQRRPSLADVLARAESRNQQRSHTPEPLPHPTTPQQQQQHSRQQSQQSNSSPSYTPTTSHSYTSNGMASSVGEGPFSLQSELLSPPTALPSAAFSPPNIASRLTGNNAHSPGTPASMTSPASSLRKAANLRQYEHIPIPPTPATASTSTSHSNSHSNAFSPSSANGGGPSSAHESVYSAASNYRSYRHTMERDRDSAMARMQMEDNFELENAAALEGARASVATSAFTGAGGSAGARVGGGGSRTRLHEHHPLSDDEREEELEEDGPAGSKMQQGSLQDDETLKQKDFVSSHVDPAQQAQMALRFSPPTNSPDSRPQNWHNLPAQQQQQQQQQHNRGNDYLTATPLPSNRKLSDSTSVSSHSARNRAAGSMPQTPLSHSPISPFAFSPAPASPVVPGGDQQGSIASQAAVPATLAEQSEQDLPFLRHHQKEPNGDFPVSVVSSRASHYPEYATLPVAEQPPMPANMQSIMKDHDAPTRPVDQSPPPVPEKTASPPSSDKRSHWNFGEARDASASPTPEPRMPFRIPEPHQDDNAGPTSEYRFPTASSRGRRPDSISSSNDHHDDGLNSMISQLEAMQAAAPEMQPISGPSPSAARPFGARGPEGGKKMLARPHPQQVFPQASPPTHHKQLPRQGSPEGKAFPINGLASQLRQPAMHANSPPKFAERSLPTQTASSPQARKADPALSEQPHISHRNGNAGNALQSVRESGNETFVFSGDTLAYHPSASAENDSAPSLVRTGTGSSSSGFSTHSDGGLAVTADVLPPTQTKEQVMSRLSQLLSTYRSQPQKPSALEEPPRQLLLHSPVLQVVNSNTVKDRYLFLFNDILVIAKPIIDEDAGGDPILPGLDSKFVVKSIVELPKLKLTAQAADNGEDAVQKRKHPLLLTFVDRFANDPRKAVSALVAKAGLSNDATTIANLLFRNPELNRSQLGAYLAHKDQKPVLKAYCDRFRLAGIRIEDALRVFIGSLRLPNDYTAAEYMLSVFASQWLANNPGTGMTNDGVFATKLVLSMMELNDALHSGIDDEATAAGNLFSFPNSAITVDDFIAAFRLKDPHGALPDEHLTRIYLSIRKDRLQQAADNAIVSGIPDIEVVTHPSRLPNRLTYRTASENISLTIPKVDPKFAIKVVGQDLRFEPPVLTFARSRTATFRVTPTALGSKAMLFIRLGPNAHLYRNLPINKTFSVERAFMNHTFQIAFVNHLGVKRKYLFSLSNAETKYSWVDTLRTKIENSPIEQPNTPRPARLSDAVSLQVLRDALIAPDEPAPVLANKIPLYGGRPGFSTPPNSRGRSAAGGPGTLQRSSSFSKTYAHGLGKAESDLAEQRRPSVSNTSLLAPLSMRRGSRDDEKAVQQQTQQQHYKTGQEIVTAVRQNSLLPLVLGFVGAGAEGIDALPRKPIYPQSAQVHTTPAQARGTGRFKDL